MDMFKRADRQSLAPIVSDQILGVSTHENSRRPKNTRYSICFDTEAGDRIRRARFERAYTEMPPSGVRLKNATEEQIHQVRGIK